MLPFRKTTCWIVSVAPRLLWRRLKMLTMGLHKPIVPWQNFRKAQGQLLKTVKFVAPTALEGVDHGRPQQMACFMEFNMTRFLQYMFL